MGEPLSVRKIVIKNVSGLRVRFNIKTSKEFYDRIVSAGSSLEETVPADVQEIKVRYYGSDDSYYKSFTVYSESELENLLKDTMYLKDINGRLILENTPSQEIIFKDYIEKNILTSLNPISAKNFDFKDGIKVTIKHKLGKIFDSESVLTGNIKSLNSWKIKGSMMQEGLNQISSLLKDVAARIVKPDVEKSLVNAQKELEESQNIVSREIDSFIDRQINKVESKIRNVESNIRNEKQRCQRAAFWAKPAVCALSGIKIANFTKQLLELEAGKTIILKGIKQGGKIAVNVGVNTAKQVVNLVRNNIKDIESFLNVANQVINGTFNITSVDFEGGLNLLVEENYVPSVRVRAKIAGIDVDQTLRLNFNDKDIFAEQLLEFVKQILLGKRQDYSQPQNRGSIVVKNIIDRDMLIKIATNRGKIINVKVLPNSIRVIDFSGAIEEISVRRRENAPGWYNGWNNYYGQRYRSILNSPSLTIDYIKIQGKNAPGFIPGMVTVQDSGEKTAVL